MPILALLMLISADPAQSASNSSEPSKFPIVREIQNIGGSGSTLISFDIDVQGRAKNFTVLETSGSAFLDEEACKTISEKAKFKPARNDMGKPVEVLGEKTRIRWNITE